MITEENNLATVAIDTMTSRDIVKTINNEDKMVALAVEQELDTIAEAVDAIASALTDGGSLIYFGAGTSGRLGILDAVECYPTFNAAKGQVRAYMAGGDRAVFDAVEGAEDSYESGVADVDRAKIKSRDVVVAISASGNPEYLMGVLDRSLSLGAKTIGVCCNNSAKMRSLCQIFIGVEVGPEVIAGSTRMKAGTAQKMILNMLSTGAMIKIGKVFQNLMVDVKCSNAKLVERAVRIVMRITGADRDQAAKFLEFSNYNIKAAVLMLVKNIDKNTAISKLDACGGVLRLALQK